MRIPAVLLIAAVSACGKSPSSTASSSGSSSVTAKRGDAADALWGLAPDKLEGGFVITPSAIGVIDKILDRVRAVAYTAGGAIDPELELLSEPLAGIAAALGGPQAHLADAGFATDKGFAFFQTEDGALIAILPVGDRDKLVKTLNGQRSANATDPDVINRLLCKPVTAVYACTKDLATFDRLGKGSMTGKLAAAGGRGDVELFLGKSIASRVKLEEIFATAVIESGQVTFQGYGKGKPAGMLATLVAADKPKPAPDNATGFVVLNLAPLLDGISDKKDADIEVIPNTSAVTLAKSIKGPMTGTMPSGALEFHAHIPLVDPAPLTALLARCAELDTVITLATQQTPGACRIVYPGPVPFELDLWVAGNVLEIATHKAVPAKGKTNVMTPIATELASGGWSYALWGRGSLVATNGVQFPPLPGALPPQASLMVRAIAQLSELGVGVKLGDDGIRVRGLMRTIWANPPDVAHKLATISADSIMKNTASATVKTIADSNPGSPFATDVAAGQAGLMAPVMALGMLASIVVPALVDRPTAEAPPSEPTP